MPRRQSQKLNLKGEKYGRLLVLEEGELYRKNSRTRTTWKCQCSCDNIVVVKTENLRNGDTKSCGCLNNEQRASRAEKMYSKNIKFHPLEHSARDVWLEHYADDNVTFKEFFILSQMSCFYCKALPSNSTTSHGDRASQFAKENGIFVYNGLDRVDNSKPHSLNNVAPCCKNCNYAKRDRSFKDFKDWILNGIETLKKIDDQAFLEIEKICHQN